MNRPRALSRIELLQGTLDLIILQTLRWGPRHGYGIAQLIRASSDEVLHVDTGSLYPALHRLERKGLLSEEWRESETGRQAKYYSLTPAGRTHLRAERKRWEQYSGAVARALAVI